MRRLTKAGGLPVLLLAAVLTDCATPRESTVVHISDGDALTVLVSGRQVKVRLAKIDGPEKRQAFGRRATQSMSDLVYGQQVQIEQQDRDRYGRVVGRVHTGGLDVKAEQIRHGLAWVYRKYNKERRCSPSKAMRGELDAGYGQTHILCPPWEFRSADVHLTTQPLA